jgi:ankyrin repeat protein
MILAMRPSSVVRPPLAVFALSKMEIGLRCVLTATLLVCASIPARAGDDPLIEAARTQDQQNVRALLSRKADVKASSADGSTALLWAAHWNDLTTAELLLRAGADPNTANDFRTTPLSQACTNGNAALVELLLKSGANPNTPIATGESPLMTCAKSGSVEAVRALIAHDADVNAREPVEHQTALMWAISQRHPAVVKMLMEAKADLHARTRKGFTVLHFAAREGDKEIVLMLLGAGVSVNVRTEPDGPATGEAGGANAAGGGNTVASTRNAKGNAPTSGYTPLLVATVRGKVELALLLLDHGADPNVADAGFTPLHWAAATWENGSSNPVYGFEDPMSGIPDRRAKLKLVKALLAHGADPNARMRRRPPVGGGYTDVAGATPFLLASSVDDVEIMQILLAAGADPKLVTSTKATAIMAATGLNHLVGESAVTEAQALAAVKFLLDLGLDPKGATSFGENALFGPAYRGWNTLLAQIIGLGVEVNAVSRAGITPWLAASGQGDRLGGVLYNNEGADLLLKHGADPKLGHPCMAQTKCRADDPEAKP